MNEQEFLAGMQTVLKEACASHPEQKGQWGWSICGFPLQRGVNMLAGINWGGRKGVPQPSMPTKQEAEAEKSPFIRGCRKTFSQLGALKIDVLRLNYVNVCPFRSPRMVDLKDEQWDFSIEHFFVPVVDFLRPARVLVMGISAVEKLLSRNRILEWSGWRRIESGRRSVSGGWGYIRGETGQYPFLAGPHPNYPEDLRVQIWRKMFADAPAGIAWTEANT